MLSQTGMTSMMNSAPTLSTWQRKWLLRKLNANNSMKDAIISTKDAKVTMKVAKVTTKVASTSTKVASTTNKKSI